MGVVDTHREHEAQASVIVKDLRNALLDGDWTVLRIEAEELAKVAKKLETDK